jgi:hypothetical protein
MPRAVPALALAALGLTAAALPPARADIVRFRYAPADPSGHVALRPGPAGAVGEWQPFPGSARREPYPCQLRPTQLVTFRNPYTCRNVTVPLALPDALPQVEHIGDRVSFNYGSYTVEVRFFPDDSVEAIYNSGFLRPIQPVR